MLHILFILLFSLFGNGISENRVSAYLKNRLGEYDKFEFKIVSLPKMLESRNVKVNFAEDKELKINGGMAYVPVYIQKKGAKTQSFITLKIKLFKNVLVARRTVRKGEKLNISDFDLMEMDVAKLRGKPVANNFEPGRYIAKRTIRKGMVLQQAMLDEKNLLGKNEIVKAVKKIGNVEISFNAKTRTSGNSGDIIKVYNYSNGKQYLGKVINKNLVQIIE